ncbi:hypothetical protein J6590_018418 [Homalodisca vitripennis]|nr:hypothetical protein J6590_018418 [Homalodisca vitripennis]
MKRKHWEWVEHIQAPVLKLLRGTPVEEFQGAFQGWQNLSTQCSAMLTDTIQKHGGTTESSTHNADIVGRADSMSMLIYLQFTFFLVQRIQPDAVADVLNLESCSSKGVQK